MEIYTFRKQYTDYNRDGGYTLAFNFPSPHEVNVAIARCSKGDIFVKKKGRELAISRLKTFNKDKICTKHAWKIDSLTFYNAVVRECFYLDIFSSKKYPNGIPFDFYKISYILKILRMGIEHLPLPTKQVYENYSKQFVDKYSENSISIINKKTFFEYVIPYTKFFNFLNNKTTLPQKYLMMDQLEFLNYDHFKVENCKFFISNICGEMKT